MPSDQLAKMSAAFGATLNPRPLRADKEPYMCSPRPPSAHDLYHESCFDRFGQTMERSDRTKSGYTRSPWLSTMRSPVHRPTKLSKARELANKCRREQIESKLGSPIRPVWVAASWNQRVRLLNIPLTRSWHRLCE